MDELKVIKRDSHEYGGSDVGLSRPITGADFLPQVFAGLDPTKSYKLVDGVFVEIGEPK